MAVRLHLEISGSGSWTRPPPYTLISSTNSPKLKHPKRALPTPLELSYKKDLKATRCNAHEYITTYHFPLQKFG